MKAFFVILLLVLFTICSYPNNFNTTLEDKICSSLSNEGFENIAVILGEKTAFVTIENRIYRNEAEGIIIAINLIVPYLEEYKNIVLITQNNALPFLKVNIPIADYDNLRRGKLSFIEFTNSFEVSLYNQEYQDLVEHKKVNLTSRKFELVIEPKIKFMFGDYSAPFKNKLDILPSLEVSLWKGMNAKMQFVLPFWNYEYYEKYNYYRFGLFTLSQNFRLPLNIFSNFTIGYFTQNQYGYEIEVGKYFFNGSLFLQGRYGKTGLLNYIKSGYEGFYNQEYTKSTFEFTDLYYNSWNISLEYIFKKYDLHFNLAYGKYLYELNSWEINIFRQFNEVNFGLQSFFMENGGINLGFNIYIPFFQRKYATNQIFRIRPTKHIGYSYLATKDIIYKYETKNRLNDIYGLINPIIIKNQIVDYLKKIYIFTVN